MKYLYKNVKDREKDRGKHEYILSNFKEQIIYIQ